MSVGIAAIPAGIAYGILVVNGYDRWWTAVLSIAFGLWLGRTAWKFVDVRLFRRDTVIDQATNFALINLTTHVEPAAAGLSAAEWTAVSVILLARQRAVPLGILGPADPPTAGETQISEELYAAAHN